MAGPGTREPRRNASDEVDDYLADLPSDMRASLLQLRKTIRAAAPKAEEIVSYRMPAFRYLGMLVWYAGFKDHCSFFAGSSVVLRKLSTEVKPFSTGKGTLQFSPQRPIPASLVRRIVRMRVAENEANAAMKRRKAKGSSKVR